MHHLEYFYAPPEQIFNDQLSITGQEFRHLAAVMRKKRGDVIQVADGGGILYTVVIAEIDKKQALCYIQKKTRSHNEPLLQLTLATGIPKSDRFEWIIEKGTETGVSTFIPLITDRSVQKGSDSKISRWQKIAISAMTQCTRCKLPEILSPVTVQELLDQPKLYDYQLIAHASAGAPGLAQVVSQLKENAARTTSLKRAIILIGPEGGFTESEIQTACSTHFHQFTLGDRRLRTETAAILSAGIVMELVNNS